MFLSAAPILRQFDNDTSLQDIAQHVGVHPATVAIWKRGGRVSWRSADEIAIKLGKHPCNLWGSEWTTLYPLQSTEDNETSV
jgi:uncharacterized protein YjcR